MDTILSINTEALMQIHKFLSEKEAEFAEFVSNNALLNSIIKLGVKIDDEENPQVAWIAGTSLINFIKCPCIAPSS